MNECKRYKYCQIRKGDHQKVISNDLEPQILSLINSCNKIVFVTLLFQNLFQNF